jgi:hypothetical protein
MQCIQFIAQEQCSSDEWQIVDKLIAAHGEDVQVSCTVNAMLK